MPINDSNVYVMHNSPRHSASIRDIHVLDAPLEHCPNPSVILKLLRRSPSLLQLRQSAMIDIHMIQANELFTSRRW